MPNDPAVITGRLNVEDYVASRKEDIKQLESLLESSGSNIKKRVFQSLPRVERRRAASHNPKRLPRRDNLRNIAQLESIKDNSNIKKKRTRKITEVNEEYTPVDLSTYNELSSTPKNWKVRYATRQRDKIWLPTHIWHKKRAFVHNISGIETPLTATQKQYRRIYRLTRHVEERGAMAWDSSFYSTIVIRAKPGVSSDDFKSSIDTLFKGSCAEIYLNGVKHWQGLYKCTLKDRDSEGPALVHWVDQKTVAVQSSPLLFSAIWDDLQQNQQLYDLEDCRFAIGGIDILGPRTLDILRSLITPTSQSYSAQWNEICQTGIIPYRFTFSLFIRDPRVAKDKAPHSKEQPESSNVFSKDTRFNSLKFGKPKSHTTPSPEIQIPICIYGLDDGRIRVILPWDWVLPFWLEIFSRRNSVLIGGQKELHQLAFESKAPFYPFDFLQTNEGLQLQEEQLKTGLDHLRTHLSTKKQIKKTFNLQGLMNEFHLNNIRHVHVTSLSKGVPVTGARIMKGKKNVGVITTGNFSLSDAKGCGIGLIENSDENDGSPYFVVNSDNCNGFPVRLEIIDSDKITRVL